MKKISFNDKFYLTQAVLDGRKTMVRFIVSQRHIEKAKAYQQEYYEGALERISIEDALLNMAGAEKMISSPYKVGEIVAVAQCYRDVPCMCYRKAVCSGDGIVHGWTNKACVKAEYMPHHVRIVSMKVERLQKISDEECLREGIFKSESIKNQPCSISYAYNASCSCFMPKWWYNTPRQAFMERMDKEYGKLTWYKNPLVWAYEIELVD